MKKTKIHSSEKSVTIIIRSKNEAKWIGSCLNSIKNQNYDHKKIEVIVLDNNSEDGTKEIAKRYKIKLINYNPKIYLPGSALNYAIKYAKKFSIHQLISVTYHRIHYSNSNQNCPCIH